MPKTSAGLLLFRRRDDALEVFIAHPGGPFWRNKNLGAWTIPKGLVEQGEDPLATAIREFREETGIEPSAPFIDLGEIRQKGGKVVRGWGCEGDADASKVVSNLAEVEWPPRSGRRITFPEIDQCGWFTPERASELINSAQAAFIDRLREALRKAR